MRELWMQEARHRTELLKQQARLRAMQWEQGRKSGIAKWGRERKTALYFDYLAFLPEGGGRTAGAKLISKFYNESESFQRFNAMRREIELLSAREVRQAANAIYDEVHGFRKYESDILPLSKRLSAAAERMQRIALIRQAFLQAVRTELELDGQASNDLSTS